MTRGSPVSDRTKEGSTRAWAELDLHSGAAVLLTAGLVVTWCMPHTIAGRLLGLALLAAFTVLLWTRGTESRGLPEAVIRRLLPWIGLSAAALTLWLFGQQWVIGDGAGKSELGSQWLMPLTFALCAYVIAWRADPARQARLRTSIPRAIALTLAGVTAANVANALWHWHEVSATLLPQQPWLYDSAYQFKVFSSQIALYLFLLSACDLLCRFVNGDAMLGFSTRVSVSLAILGVLGILASLSRNALIVWTLICGLLPILAATGLKRRLRSRRHFGLVLAAACAVAAVCVVGVSLDKRWPSTWDGLTRAWDNSGKDLSWVRHWDRSAVLAAQGIERGDGSAYERMTYIMLGARLLIANPLGVGFRRTAFTDALGQRFGPGDYLHSHSGIVEFGVGAGIPGLALFVVLGGLILLLAWRRWRQSAAWPAAALVLMTSAYVLRGIVDNTMRNQFAEMAFFVIGFLLGALCAISASRPLMRDDSV